MILSGDLHLPALLPALAHLTGDNTILRPEFRPPGTTAFGQVQGGLTEEQQAGIRALGVTTLARWRDCGQQIAVAPTEIELLERMSFATGLELADLGSEYLPFLREELQMSFSDVRAPQWNANDIAPDRPFNVVIIGAGMSGLVAAHRLKQAGVTVIVMEKNSDVGGTWLENEYPGCRVDVQNHVYSYSFRQRSDWPFYYSDQRLLLNYFRTCADEFGIRPLIRFETEVTRCEWSDESRHWHVHIRTPDGRSETVIADAVIGATGQLNRPKFPDIAGRETFTGQSFHSAQWDPAVDLKGKRVAVIGTGASAAQFIPHVAPQAAQLTVFQRTANWLIPVETYHSRVPDSLRWLFDHVPTFLPWYRFWAFWRNSEGILAAVRVNRDFAHSERSVSPINEQVRAALTMYLDTVYAGRPDLLEKMTPTYPPFAKRMIIEAGTYAPVFLRPNVELVTDAIESIDATGVWSGGVHYPADVIIYSTGFSASNFLTPMTVKGTNGIDLHEHWAGDARAHLGIVLPHFPNFFLMYGPNTNIVVNGSIIFFSESETNYIVEYVRMLLASGAPAFDCRTEAHDRYNAWIDAGNAEMTWGYSKVNAWYKNATGRVSQNWPHSLLEFWQQTRHVDPSHYVTIAAPPAHDSFGD